jgi:hypothetical protein
LQLGSSCVDYLELPNILLDSDIFA